MMEHGPEIDMLVREIRLDGVDVSKSRAAVLLTKISVKDKKISVEEFRKSVALMNELGYHERNLAAFCGITVGQVARWELGTSCARDYSRKGVLVSFAKGLRGELKI